MNSTALGAENIIFISDAHEKFYYEKLKEVLSIFWKVTVTTIPEQMLMYGKEASNRKQEIDRQHYTIPNQRPKDKHCGKI